MSRVIVPGEEYMWKPYRWVILVLLGLTQLVPNIASGQINALGPTLMEQLNISASQFASISSANLLVGAILGIVGGAIADKFGIKRVIAVALIIGAAGAFWRAQAVGYLSLFTSMVLIGFIIAITMANAFKIINVWFHPSQFPFAMSVYVATSTIGNIIGITTTPRLIAAGATMEDVFNYCAYAFVALTVAWLIFAKEKVDGVELVKSEAVISNLGECLKNGKLWLVAIASGCIFGCIISGSTFLVTTLNVQKGVAIIEAANWATISAFAFMIGVMFLPTLIVKSGYIKGGVQVTCLISAVLLVIGWVMDYSVLSMIILQLGVLFFGCTLPIIKNMVGDVPNIKKEALGTAGGVQGTVQSLCGFLLPSYVIGAFGNVSLDFIWYGMAGLLVLTSIVLLGMPETGSKKKKA